jgi:RNA-binding protein
VAKLTARQRAELKAKAHPLKPILQIGKDGVTLAVARTIENAFNTRELLKVKVLESAPEDARSAAESLTGMLDDAHVVQVIGRTIVLYREQREKPARSG